MTGLQKGDTVTVQNKDGETTDGTVVTVHETTVSEYTKPWMDSEETLLNYWGGTVSPDERVVTVDLSNDSSPVSSNYAYPESKVSLDDDED